ncbi:MAG: hypothetical protein QM535_11335 [Limnohabitans sp.]|nr:hypothetical protein [Limnohabitans sp.]
MKKLSIKILLVFYCTVIISCNKKAETVKTNDNTKKIDSFEYNLKNKEKIFLDFWSGINREDFYKVCHLLQSKNKMGEDYKYKLGDTEVSLSRGNYLQYDCGNIFYNRSKNETIECIYLLLHTKAVKFFFDKEVI